MGTVSIKSEMPVKRAYKKIYDLVVNGNINPGNKIPPERLLVNEINVSRPTISKAVNMLVAEGVLCKKEGRKGTFLSKAFDSANGHNARLFSDNHKDTGFVKFAVSPDYAKVTVKNGVMEGLHSVFSKLGIHTVIEYIDFANGWREKAIGNGCGDFLGLILWATPEYFNHEDVAFFIERQTPVVCVDTHPDEENDANFVVSDNTFGAKLAVNYLVSQGHKRICYMANAEDSHLSSLIDRKTGFIMGMLQNSLRFSSDNIIEFQSDLSDLWAALDRVFVDNNGPTAIFVSNDKYAMAVIEYLRTKGLKCPDDVSIIGYDDIDMAQYMPVPLTTIHQNFFEMGEVAAKILYSAITSSNNSMSDVPYHVFLKPTLVERKSVKTINNL